MMNKCLKNEFNLIISNKLNIRKKGEINKDKKENKISINMKKISKSKIIFNPLDLYNDTN